jgi:hypothetical protein
MTPFTDGQIGIVHARLSGKDKAACGKQITGKWRLVRSVKIEDFCKEEKTCGRCTMSIKKMQPNEQ